MKASSHGLIYRSSSVTFSIAPRPDINDPLCDDMTIAQELLIRPKPPRRRNSFTGPSLPGFDSSNDDPSSTSPIEQTEDRPRRAHLTSNTWTSSSGDVLSDQDEVDDRSIFIQEYNRLARKHGVRPIVADDYEPFNDDSTNTSTKAQSWYRKLLRRTSSSQSIPKPKPERHLRHNRSISDLSQRLMLKKDKLKDKDLQELVRLCGLSLLYLPAEYAAASLSVPTCFRATAQYLVQHGINSRGIFRIPGSHSIVGSLYNHYCSIDRDGEVVAGTVRCPTLPEHIRCDVHDVASAFKRFLSGLPGGILGSLPLFDAFISIQSQLQGEPELTRTKQTKLRARLIALAIGSLRSQYRRELICAVFGLLCMIGRTAEISRREDERGRPLPTSDLMGYGPLGIVFGPLLIGDLLEDYTMRLANPHGGLILLPISPPKSRKERKKHEKEKEKSKSTDGAVLFNTHVDKIKVANSITEMLITHWRDVVRHMRNLSALKVMGGTKNLAARGAKQPFLRPSASDTFALRKPPNWDEMKSPMRTTDIAVSPTPIRRFTSPVNGNNGDNLVSEQSDTLTVRKQRSRLRPMSSQRLSGARSLSILSPTVEECTKEDDLFEAKVKATWRNRKSIASSSSEKENKGPPLPPGQMPPLPSSNGKPNIFGINPSKYMESTLSLAKGVPKETPSKLLKHNKVASSFSERESSPRFPEAQAKIQSSLGKGKLPKFPSKYHQHGSSPLRNEPQDESLAPLSKTGPKIKILRASSPSIEGIAPGHVRRMAGSEPGLQPKMQIVPRRISRSLYDDPKRKKSILATFYPFNKDPLLRVSREEDEASLAQLAEALSVDALEDRVQDLECKTTALVEEVVGEVAARRRLDVGLKHLRNANYDGKHSNLEACTAGDPSASVHARKFGQIQKQELQNKRLSGLSGDSEPRVSPNDTSPQIPIAPEASMDSSPRRRNLNSTASGPGNKLSTLIAKFNTPESKGLPARPHTASPIRSPTNPIVGSPRERLESPKGSLIAPYTSNPPSPTRSQKSTKSNKSLQSARNPLSVDFCPNYDGTLANNPGPGRVSQVYFKNLVPKGAISKPLDEDIGSPTIRPLSAFDLITFSPPQTLSRRGNIASLNKPLQEPSPLVQSSPGSVYESSINGRSSSVNIEVREVHRSRAEIPGPLDCRASNKNPGPLHCIGSSVDGYPVPSTDGPSSKPSSASSETTHSNMYRMLLTPISGSSLSEVPRALFASDDPPSTLITGEILTRADPPPIDHQLGFSRPITTVAEADIANSFHRISPFKEAYHRSRSISPAPTPPLGRSNSVLYTQIRDLQKQLTSKNEEARHLRQQLDARANLDIGTLSEHLREAKREIQVWKMRAEVAEKQVEIFAKVQTRSNSHVTVREDQIQRSSTDYGVGEKKMAERIRRTLHGGDGAGSSHASSSKESLDTVIREEAIGSEYSAWIEQSTSLLNVGGLHELE